MIFTFHNRAAQVLDRFWEENRLPPFEVSPSNTSAVVVLGGLKDVEQAKELLRVYLEDARIEMSKTIFCLSSPARLKCYAKCPTDARAYC